MHESPRLRFSRRQFLTRIAAAAAALLPVRLAAQIGASRTLSFIHTHTGERATVMYFTGGAYDTNGLTALNHLLRDHVSGDEHPMDPALFDILYELRLSTDTRQPFQVISGYRSPRTNAMLRARGPGIAAGSLHMQGRAIDVRLADVSSARLRDQAIALKRGGVGYYAASDFVHVDTGSVRRW